MELFECSPSVRFQSLELMKHETAAEAGLVSETPFYERV